MTELGEQPGDLSPGQASDLLQVAPDQTLVRPAQTGIAEAAQLGSDPVIGGSTGRGFEAEGLSPGEKGAGTWSRSWSPWVMSMTIILR
jgi:hypothetical protein